MNPEVFKYSVEQSFTMRRLADEVPRMRRQDLEELILELAGQLMIKENVVRSLVKDKFNV